LWTINFKQTKTNIMNKNNVIFSIILLGMSLSSCKESDVTKTKTLNIRMTDAPAMYTAVNIDVQGVEIVGNDGKTILMNTNKKIYNILNFANGKDTLLATAGIEAASVQQIRLILGSNNSIVVGGTNYPLSTPSADQSGLKLLVNQILEPGITNSITIDFDANKSIVEQGNGVYKLKPALRTIVAATSGSISGKITPIGTLAIVTATAANNETFTTNVSAIGDFVLSGIPSGTYSITITPLLPLLPSTQANVVVVTGMVTNMGTVNF
jgi:Domain of unknown function (DUF4382)